MVSPCKSLCPRKSRKESKNPYSNRGLDKFSELLSELDEKRQSIYSKKLDSGGPPLVRFVFTSSGECIPVVIKSSYLHKKKKTKDVAAAEVKKVVKESKTEETKKTEPETEQKQSCVLNENLKKITRPNHFLPVTVILVLVFLAFFGRSVAIMCTCIAWYLVPTVKEQSGNGGSSSYYAMKKRDFARKLSIEDRASFNPRTVRDHSPLK
uniref:ZCF37 n=1 Tax=Noccaea caerulescens TaxID=107243 RepID=A0A1J3I180_NOCCA